jgi:hypothetical protein
VVREEWLRLATLLELRSNAIILRLGTVREIRPPGRRPHRLRSMGIPLP